MQTARHSFDRALLLPRPHGSELLVIQTSLNLPPPAMPHCHPPGDEKGPRSEFMPVTSIYHFKGWGGGPPQGQACLEDNFI